jgi:exonuclease III
VFAFAMISESFKNFHLTISAINCNTMNVSTLGNRNSKTYIKIEGLTGKRTDIILFSDVRAGSKAKDIEGLFRMTKNGNYVTYINSTRNSRGVGIAIKKSISHKVHRRIEDRDTENYII